MKSMPRVSVYERYAEQIRYLKARECHNVEVWEFLDRQGVKGTRDALQKFIKRKNWPSPDEEILRRYQQVPENPFDVLNRISGSGMRPVFSAESEPQTEEQSKDLDSESQRVETREERLKRAREKIAARKAERAERANKEESVEERRARFDAIADQERLKNLIKFNGEEEGRRMFEDEKKRERDFQNRNSKS